MKRVIILKLKEKVNPKAETKKNLPLEKCLRKITFRNASINVEFLEYLTARY